MGSRQYLVRTKHDGPLDSDRAAVVALLDKHSTDYALSEVCTETGSLMATAVFAVNPG